jgi:diguanylate cyclase (GGDEF)-like protein
VRGVTRWSYCSDAPLTATFVAGTWPSRPVCVPIGLGQRGVRKISALRAHRWPRLLLLVFGVSLALVALTGFGLTAIVGQHVQTTAIASAASADRSLAQSFAENSLTAADMTIGGSTEARIAAVQQALLRLVETDADILRLKVHAPDGTILYSDDPTLRGQMEGGEELEQSLATRLPTANLEVDSEDEPNTEPGGAVSEVVIEEYLPIIAPDGTVEAVFEIYRDGEPLLAAISQAQTSALSVVLLAAIVLAGLLWYIFNAAQVRLDRQTRDLLEASRRDSLTGLLSHGTAVAALVERLEDAHRAQAEGRLATVCVALIDLDNFRNLNDTHGHGAGDRALIEVSRLLSDELPAGVVLGRFGPDEFIAFTQPEPGHDLEGTLDRIRDRLIDLSLQFGASERLPITISAGLSWFPTNGEAATELLSQATIALVEAKSSGGNAIRRATTAEVEAQTSQAASFDTLQGLVLVVDARDRYTKRHSEDVARYALVLADRLGVDADVRRPLHIAGLLHDVGKIGIPDTILRKPASLTAEEYEVVKQHVALGDAIVRDLPDIEVVRAGIRSHHERWDGRGYLAGLTGEGIPLIGRMLAVADAFSAMTTDRPYRKALAVEEAIRRLEDAAGSQLDPTLVATFVAAVWSIGPDAILARHDAAALPRLIQQSRVA